MMVHELRERLRELSADIVFLQEVQGLHLGHAERHADWPSQPQHEFLAEDVWHNHCLRPQHGV
jgi:endonuclease/exonuclease/phosphatase family metal-dependent hydrolase